MERPGGPHLRTQWNGQPLNRPKGYPVEDRPLSGHSSIDCICPAPDRSSRRTNIWSPRDGSELTLPRRSAPCCSPHGSAQGPASGSAGPSAGCGANRLSLLSGLAWPQLADYSAPMPEVTQEQIEIEARRILRGRSSVRPGTLGSLLRSVTTGSMPMSIAGGTSRSKRRPDDCSGSRGSAPRRRAYHHLPR